MKKSRRKNRKWTTDSKRELRVLARHKVPAPVIAETLRHTEGSTRQMAFTLGVSLDSR